MAQTGYTDAQGRPELVVHRDIVRGGAGYRLEEAPADAPQLEAADRQLGRDAPGPDHDRV